MKTRFWCKMTICLSLFLLSAFPAQAFMKDGCGAGECRDCHELSKEDAANLLSTSEAYIVDVKFSEIPGLWEVDVKQQEKVIPVFIDFSKQYLISGTIIKIANKQDITRDRFINLNRIDVSRIPLDDALVIGNPAAQIKIIVFDDPQCPYCAKLHKEMKHVVGKRPDMAFFIKMFPLKSHPDSYARAKAIVCAKSTAMLEDSLSGKAIEAPSCETDQIEKNMELAEHLGIRSTPTLIFPDGRVMPGYKTGEEIIRIMDPEPNK